MNLICRRAILIGIKWTESCFPWLASGEFPLSRIIRRGMILLLFIPSFFVALYQFAFYLVAPGIDFVVTPRCTLRCKDCANLMQYYQEPADCDTDSLLGAAKKLTDTFDWIDSIVLIGGEPFLHKELHLLCEYFCANKKVGKVNVVTNGTIIPSEDALKALSHKKVTILISGYEIVAKKAEKLIAKLKERRIKYRYGPIPFWRDLGSVEHRGRTFSEVARVFRGCMGMCHTLYEGEYHLCPRSAHGMHLGLVKRRENDFVSIKDLTKNEARKALRRLLYHTKALEACQHCDNARFIKKTIPVAIQLSPVKRQ